MSDPIHPEHYRAHPSGVEAIAITEHFNFCIGNVIKYCWRAGRKGDALEDLRKARYYLDREIARLAQEQNHDAAIRENQCPAVCEGLPAAPNAFALRRGAGEDSFGDPRRGPRDSEALPDAARDADRGRGVSEHLWVSDPVAW